MLCHVPVQWSKCTECSIRLGEFLIIWNLSSIPVSVWITVLLPAWTQKCFLVLSITKKQHKIFWTFHGKSSVFGSPYQDTSIIYQNSQTIRYFCFIYYSKLLHFFNKFNKNEVVPVCTGMHFWFFYTWSTVIFKSFFFENTSCML